MTKQWGQFRGTPRMFLLKHFLTTFMWNRALAKVSYTFCQPHLPKVLRTPQFLGIWSANRALAIPVHFLSTTFPDRAASPRKQRPYLGDPKSHITRKTQGFQPDSVFTREVTCFRTVTLPNCLMMGGWHVDVVDMMMGLTCWCGWHDGGMLNMTIVRNSEVFWLNFLWLAMIGHLCK